MLTLTLSKLGILRVRKVSNHAGKALLASVAGVESSKLVAQRLLATVQPVDRRPPIARRWAAPKVF